MFTVSVVSPLSLWSAGMAAQHANGWWRSSWEFCILIHRQQKERTLPSMGFWNFKAHLQWHISSNKATLLNPSNLINATKHSNIWAYLGHSCLNQHSGLDSGGWTSVTWLPWGASHVLLQRQISKGYCSIATPSLEWNAVEMDFRVKGGCKISDCEKGLCSCIILHE